MKKILLLVAGLGLVAAPVLAGQNFGRTDTNGDHKITLQEMQAQVNRHFQALDSNHDGRISQAERAQKHPGRKRQGPHGQKNRPGFKGPDTDQDGQISQAEAQAAAQKRFARLDTNHDGVVSEQELQQRKAKRQERRHRQMI